MNEGARSRRRIPPAQSPTLESTFEESPEETPVFDDPVIGWWSNAWVTPEEIDETVHDDEEPLP